MDHTKVESDQNSKQPLSDNLIPFTEAQLSTLASRQTQYFSEARTKINYDMELAAQLDDRVASAIKEGKRIKISLEHGGFLCE